LVTVTNQNIPSEIYASYIVVLQISVVFEYKATYGKAVYGVNKYGEANILYVKKRNPFRLPATAGY